METGLTTNRPIRLPWSITGLLAAIAYTAAVVLGGALTPGYSHARDAISSLTQTGSTVIPVVVGLFAAYNALLLLFAAGLWAHLRRWGHRQAALGALALVVVGLAGVLMFWFTQDPVGTPLTVRGLGHFVLAGFQALGTITGILLCGLNFRRIPGLGSLRGYSVVTAVVILLSGGIGTPTMSMNPYFGIVERVIIFSFILWIFVVSLRLTVGEPAKANPWAA